VPAAVFDVGKDSALSIPCDFGFVLVQFLFFFLQWQTRRLPPNLPMYRVAWFDRLTMTTRYVKMN
jgi:hypothetical protein